MNFQFYSVSFDYLFRVIDTNFGQVMQISKLVLINRSNFDRSNFIFRIMIGEEKFILPIKF